MRQEPLSLLRLSSETSEPAGRRPALTFPKANCGGWVRSAPMRQGPLELLRLSTETPERAGRRPAQAFLDSSGRHELPKLC